MNSLDKVFKILARDSEFWLPSYDNIEIPLSDDGTYIPDTEDGFNYYCKWLTEYLTTTTLAVPKYQFSIIKRLKKRNEISDAYILGNAGLSTYCFHEFGLEKYPEDFLEDPNPKRISIKELNRFKSYFQLPKFKGLDVNENLQASLVFEYIAIQQNKELEKIKGPRWADIGWRCILKEGLQTISDEKEKINFAKNFINEIVYLQSK